MVDAVQVSAVQCAAAVQVGSVVATLRRMAACSRAQLSSFAMCCCLQGALGSQLEEGATQWLLSALPYFNQ